MFAAVRYAGGPTLDRMALSRRTAALMIVRRSLMVRDVRFEAKPHMVAKLPHAELWMSFFRDSEGNLLALSSERAAGQASEPRA